ncbi:protein NLP6-like isoform X1 [Salvia hispanica]|uniref:protein NLP6-like isoform X1 n=1 Tax=Salvia hispanica TaxID=49212 RepID=UPI0020098681|nr:protein NLP6-like isoform X1 [Salvia hispanica]
MPEDDTPRRPPDLLMDLDLDLDSSWPLDQIFAAAANSDQPCSPLWAFPDDNLVAGAGFRFSDSSKIFSYSGNPVAATEGALDNHDKKKLTTPLVGLMPIDNQDGSCIIKQRMTQALRYFKDLTEQHVLAQVWAPVKNGSRYVLTTSGQPFVLDPNSNGLHQYRLVSLSYMFSVDGDTDGDLGLPGRVFRQKLPEWTPNVQYYTSKEFPRLSHALNYNVRGTLALPVFEPSGQSCVGVLELIMTSQKINYAPEVDKVCKALEAVNLKSSEILDHQSTQQICNEGRQNALAEILEIITVVCETHTLPLAQTWVPCRHRSILANGGGFKKSCSSFDGSCMGQVCMSTTDVAFYVVDANMWGFRDACAEHHLQKGQGVAGRAFESLNSCFCHDITEFCKTEYPLVHYARMFGLKSSFAICLRSNHTGNDDYVLEFFLPPNVESYEDQQSLLNSLLVTVKQHFGSLRVASGKDLDHEWRSIEIIKASMDEKLNMRPDFAATSPPRPPVQNGESRHLDAFKGQLLMGEFCGVNGKGNISSPTGLQNGASGAEAKVVGKKPERKRGKAEKSISLEVLQQYFAGSLKDAAKSLGVCPTTMKRICRQHGISRWPSRKINKVNRSLSKLKRVIESVQGGEGTFSLTSLATSSSPVTAGPISWAPNMNGTNQQSSPGSGPCEFQEEKKEVATKSHGADEQAEASNHFVGDRSTKYEKLTPNGGGFVAEGSHRSRDGSGSREESTGTPTSQGSCQGSPSLRNETSPQNDPVVSPMDEHRMKLGGSQGGVCQQTREINLSSGFSIPGNFIPPPDGTFGGMLVEDAGSSHDLRNLCPAGEPLFEEHVTEYSWTRPTPPDPMPEDCIAAPAEDHMPRFSARPEVKTITIKATYREDIIRFRLPIDSGIVKLKEEVAKRFKLELGTFDIKYLDDDHEWVLIACDADLLECFDVSGSSGGNIIRLLVHDIMANLGSSCESSGE